MCGLTSRLSGPLARQHTKALSDTRASQVVQSRFISRLWVHKVHRVHRVHKLRQPVHPVHPVHP